MARGQAPQTLRFWPCAIRKQNRGKKLLRVAQVKSLYAGYDNVRSRANWSYAKKTAANRSILQSSKINWLFSDHIKPKQCNVYIRFSFFCKPSILLSSVSISSCFLQDFARRAFDFTHKSIVTFLSLGGKGIGFFNKFLNTFLSSGVECQIDLFPCFAACI